TSVSGSLYSFIPFLLTSLVDGIPLPTLTCYVISLPPATPFRVSIHSWASKAKPTPAIESKRKPHQRVVYILQVVVDGDRVFHGSYELSAKWPQEIAQEKRGVTEVDRPSSSRNPVLPFPSFQQSVLIRSSLDVRNNSGRINILLSEQLVSKNNSLGELELGASNDIVCFSFQHAPREILEQAGISWPIRNPLFLPSPNNSHSATSQTPNSHIKSRDSTIEGRAMSPISRILRPAFPKPHKPEPYSKPKTEPHAHLPPFPRPPTRGKMAAPNEAWTDSMSGSFGTLFDEISMMDTWSTRQTSSSATANISTTDLLASPPSSEMASAWQNHNPIEEQERAREKAREEQRRRSERQERQVVMALRDDQFETLIEAISPQKKGLQHDQSSSHWYDQDRKHQMGPSTHQPPRMAPMGPPMNTRPSAAALARTSSYSDLNSNSPFRNAPVSMPMASKGGSSTTNPYDDKRGGPSAHKSPLTITYHPSYASDKENIAPNPSRAPTPRPSGMSVSTESRVPTPYPFPPRHLPGSANPPYYTSWGGGSGPADIEIRDSSSMFSSLVRGRTDLNPRSQHPPHPYPGSTKGSPALAPLPAASGSVKSRKEGLGLGTATGTGTGTETGSPTGPRSQQASPRVGLAQAQQAQSQSQDKQKSVPRSTTPGSTPLTRIENIVHTNMNTNAEDRANRGGIGSGSPERTHTQTKTSQQLQQQGSQHHFVPGHKSHRHVDSIDKIERQLWSALGDEMATFDAGADIADADVEHGNSTSTSFEQGHNDAAKIVSPVLDTGGLTLAQLGELEQAESAVVKRKRQGSVGGGEERGRGRKVSREEGKGGEKQRDGVDSFEIIR
ncbi:hypothetical protein BCR34DRAFT_163502, partial [Clohesyomyces aquaticus]